jgi:hypothetical protein
MCARPGCGLTAATTLLVDGRRVAEVCSERCGYELIGPKRSAEDDASAERNAAHQREAVRRMHDSQRFGDMAKLAAALAELGTVRARLHAMSPIEVATATMEIGRRIARDGRDIEQRVEAVIFDAVTAINHIVRDEPYQMPDIAAELAKLRADIAADNALDVFDGVTGRALKAAGVPDDVRQLAAYRTRPVEIMAMFRVTVNLALAREKAFYEDHQKHTIVIENQAFQRNGKLLSSSPDRTRLQDICETAGFRPGSEVDLMRWHSANNWFTINLAHNPAVIVPLRNAESPSVFVTNKQHAGSFAWSDATEVLSYARFNPATKAFEPPVVLPITIRGHSAISIDSDGNTWIVATNGLYVLSPSGTPLSVDAAGRPAPVIAFPLFFMVAAASDEGVWVVKTTAHSPADCTKLRVVPYATYTAGM